MRDLYTDIWNWSRDTFPNAKPEHHLLKCKQEIDEAIKDPSDIKEYADCFIALISAVSRSGFDFDVVTMAIWQKLQVNKKRQWNENKDGTHQHK